jgi:hypothetical protein
MNDLEQKFWQYFKPSFVEEKNDIKIHDENGIINLSGGRSVSFKLGNKRLPFKFGKTDGSFFTEHSGITTLDGSPDYVAVSFNCSYNNLKTLKGAPSFCGNSFACIHNKLKNLVGAPQHVKASFNCSSNELTSLLGAPSKLEFFICSNNSLLTLEHGPKIATEKYACSNNPLTSLLGAPDITEEFECKNHYLTSLEHLPKPSNLLILSISNNLPILRLVLQSCHVDIEHFSNVMPVTKIINKYTNSKNKKAATLAFQKDLIDNDYVGNASW